MTKVSKRDVLLGSKVALISTKNEKKAGSMSFDRFAIMMAMCANGATPTVGELLKAGYRMDDVRHDQEHGFIAVGDEAIAGVAEQKALDRLTAIEQAKALLAEEEARIAAEKSAAEEAKKAEKKDKANA